MNKANGYSKNKRTHTEVTRDTKTVYSLDCNRSEAKHGKTHTHTNTRTIFLCSNKCFHFSNWRRSLTISLWLKKNDSLIRALPQTFISGCCRLGTHRRQCACSRAAWSWGLSTAGSLTSSLPSAPGSIGTCAPPAVGRATWRHWETT